jgi:hypothetical protein
MVAPMVEGGLAGIAAVMFCTAWLSLRLSCRGSARARITALALLGTATVGAFAGTFLLAGIVAALVLPTLAALAGLTIALFRIEDDDSPEDADDGDPPWWPTFERQLRSYERQRVRS